jgi:hypothetical protein
MMTRWSGYYPTTWRTSLIQPSKTSKNSMNWRVNIKATSRIFLHSTRWSCIVKSAP